LQSNHQIAKRNFMVFEIFIKNTFLVIQNF